MLTPTNLADCVVPAVPAGASPVAPATLPLFDAAAVAAELETLAERHAGHERELRHAVAQRLKVAIIEARAQAKRLLLEDRRGRLCAERLCLMQDQIIGLLFDFAR